MSASTRIIAKRATRLYGVNWWLWRIATSRDIPDSYSEVRRMTFAATVEAHAVIDALDTMREAAEQERRDDERARRAAGGR